MTWWRHSLTFQKTRCCYDMILCCPPPATEANAGQRSGNKACSHNFLPHEYNYEWIRFSLWWILLSHSWILTQTHNCFVHSQSIKANTKVHTLSAKESFTWFWVVVYNFWRPYSREFEWAIPVNTKISSSLMQVSRILVVSLVPRPHPLTRRNGLVNQVEFLGLGGALATM